MKKTFLCALVLCAISGKLFAQTSTSNEGKFSIGIDAGLPVGSTNTPYYSVAIGGDLKYSLPIADKFSVSLSAGYTDVLGKDVNEHFTEDGVMVNFDGKFADAHAIPVKAGLRYSPDGPTGFFAEAQAGATFVTQGGGTSFAYAPAVGYAFDKGFEAGVRYEGWVKDGTFSQVALRVAYSF